MHAAAHSSVKAALALLQSNVFVVGDPDQAIYGWRGANVVNMSQSFNDDYPGEHCKSVAHLKAVTLVLQWNYVVCFFIQSRAATH